MGMRCAIGWRVVAGATRGAGRGIAAALGEAGATVICTGRSSVSGNAQSDYDRPETIEETAELVTELGGTGIAVQVDHLDIAAVRGTRGPHPRRPRRDRRSCQRHLGRGGPQGRPAVVEQADLGARPRRRSADTSARHRHPPDHVALPAAAAGRPARWTARRGDGRHEELQRRQLSDLGVLRPGEGRGQPAGLQPWPRVGAVRCHRRRGDAGLAALGDDARQLGCDRRQLARRRWTRTAPTAPSLPRASPSRRRRDTSGAVSPRSPPTSAGRAGTSARSRPPNWLANTASPTSTAASPDGWV